jgi:hypothetical protein
MWEIGNEHAHAILLSMLLEMYQIKSIDQETATGTWKIISSKFDNQSVMVQVDLLWQMNQVWCAEDSDPHETIQMLQALRAKYALAGGCLNLPQFTAIILSAIPDKYCPLLHTLIATTWANSQTLNPNNLISHIPEATKHHDDFTQAQAKKDNTALATQAAGKQGNQTNPPRRERKCDNCSKERHWQ